MIQKEDDAWGIIELLGHNRIAGKITEEEKFGVKLGRVDVPEGDGFMTVYFGGASVYRITIVTEQVARNVCKQTSPAPVSPWDFPKQLTSLPHVTIDTYESRNNDDDFDDDEPHER